MSQLVLDAIDAEIASLTRLVDTPVEPFGYGSDISGAADLDPDMAEVSGDTTLALAQALVRRLDCPRGTLIDDGNYGIDLRGYCNRPTTTSELRALAGQVRAELQKDDRVDSITVRLEPTSNGNAFALKIRVEPIDPRVGGFALTLAVTSATIIIEALEEAA